MYGVFSGVLLGVSCFSPTPDLLQCGVGVLDAGARDGAPAWPLRNVLLLMARTTRRDALSVLCVRERFSNGKRTIGMSMVMRVEQLAGAALAALDADSTVAAAGWERNKHGKLAPRRIELGASMDPKRLAATGLYGPLLFC